MTDHGVTLVWRTTDMFTWGTAPLLIDGYIYLAHFGMYIPIYQQVPTSLRYIDVETGQVKWSESLGPNRADKSIALASANGILIVLDELGTLSTARASPEGFEVIASCDVLQGEKKPRVFWTPPVLCNARIYCRNFGGDLVCIDVGK